jgi:outer membrane assembly lipoprotein YfiO
MKLPKVFAFLLIFFLPSVSAFAYWVWSPEKGEFVSPDGKAGQGAAEEQFDYAMKFYHEKNYDEAAKQFEDIVKKYPQVNTASEALYRLGTIYEEKGDYLKAFQTYKKMVDTYPHSERYLEVIEREFRIGNLFLSGKKAKLMGLEILPSAPRAVEVFENIVRQAPFSEFGDKAQFHLGLAYKQDGKYSEAVEAFQAVIDKYPDSDLVAKARYQVAETAYDRSNREFRDQRALDEASKQVDKFLTKYPDAGISEQAAKLRQTIDEKNAEKNYRIGLYYEKEKYLQSALIYYSEVAQRYPQTSWGVKAAEKTKVLKSPAEYHSEKEKQISQEIALVKQQLQSVPESDKAERSRLEAQLQKMEKQKKEIEGKEREGLKSRADDIRRRQNELKEKFKKLEEKKKMLKTNKSEDFQRAIERWHASLIEEQESLAAERRQLEDWQGEMGLEPKGFLDYLPFLHERPSELETVRRIKSKKLYKLGMEKSKLLESKEKEYRDYEKLTSELGQIPKPVEAGAAAPLKPTEPEKPAAPPEDDWKSLMEAASGEEFKAEREKVAQSHAEVERLGKELEQKRQLYEDHYGRPAWLLALSFPAKAFTNSTGFILKPFGILNPFVGDQKPEDMKPQELIEWRMHLKEQAAAEQNIIDSLTQAFDSELALQEQRRILASLENKEKIDPAELRKSIKNIEREIRSRYEEIQDRHDRKKQLLKELDAEMNAKKQGAGFWEKTGQALASPAVVPYRFAKMFLFGLQNHDQKITEEARELSKKSGGDDPVKILKDQIELESIVIEAKSQEIAKLRKELEALKAKAALSGGFKFRSSIVQVPYQFIGEAVESAKQIVPKKNREEILIQRLNEETSRMEKIRAQLKHAEAVMSEKGLRASEEKPKADVAKPEPEKAGDGASQGGESKSGKVPPPAALKEEIQALANQLEIGSNIYEREKAILRNMIEERKGAGAVKEKAPPSKKPEAKAAAVQTESPVMTGKERSKKLKQLKSTEDGLKEIIRREDGLEAEELSILESRIEAVDRLLGKVRSKATKQDLITEKQRMEERISQIHARRAFLAEELKRFDTTGAGFTT